MDDLVHQDLVADCQGVLHGGTRDVVGLEGVRLDEQGKSKSYHDEDRQLAQERLFPLPLPLGGPVVVRRAARMPVPRLALLILAVTCLLSGRADRTGGVKRRRWPVSGEW